MVSICLPVFLHLLAGARMYTIMAPVYRLGTAQLIDMKTP